MAAMAPALSDVTRKVNLTLPCSIRLELDFQDLRTARGDTASGEPRR